MTRAASVRFTPITGAEDSAAFGAMLAPAHGGDADAGRQIIEQTRSFLKAHPRPDPWGSYLAWDGDAPVGVCAFKFPPDEGGSVEIAYGTFPAHEGQGYAKAMISALVELAGRSGASAVIAHTLAQTNASNRALTAQGFSFCGDVVDPEDGPVWRWARRA